MADEKKMGRSCQCDAGNGVVGMMQGKKVIQRKWFSGEREGLL